MASPLPLCLRGFQSSQRVASCESCESCEAVEALAGQRDLQHAGIGPKKCNFPRDARSYQYKLSWSDL